MIKTEITASSAVQPESVDPRLILQHSPSIWMVDIYHTQIGSDILVYISW